MEETLAAYAIFHKTIILQFAFLNVFEVRCNKNATGVGFSEGTGFL